MANLSELFLAILLALGLAAPGTPADTHGPGLLGVAVAEQGGNLDPDGFTSPPDEGEKGGDFDPNGFTSLPDEGDKRGNFDPDGFSPHGRALVSALLAESRGNTPSEPMAALLWAQLAEQLLQHVHLGAEAPDLWVQTIACVLATEALALARDTRLPKDVVTALILLTDTLRQGQPAAQLLHQVAEFIQRVRWNPKAEFTPDGPAS